MKRRLLSAALVGVSLVAMACGGDSPDSPAPTATLDFGYELETYDLEDLVYWDSLYTVNPFGAPRPLERLVAEMGESGDARYEPYLVELALYPTPYRETAAEALLGDPDATIGDILDYIGERGRKQPSDDDAMYLRFKQRLMGSIIPDFAGFLEPDAERAISAQEIVWGGVATDGIPPLDEPHFVTPEEASDWIVPSDQVIGVEINGDVRAYPRRIIDWHEMVNDTVGGVPVSLAYCTLCGSAILYDGRLDGKVYRFGTSGMLYRSNKLMYDRETRIAVGAVHRRAGLGPPGRHRPAARRSARRAHELGGVAGSPPRHQGARHRHRLRPRLRLRRGLRGLLGQLRANLPGAGP